MMIPKEFFVTSGKAISSVSELNAFDLALEKAGIAQCNLVYVSSILPPKCRFVDYKRIPTGAITFVVMSKMSGRGGERISAGLIWGFGEDEDYGIVAEAHGNYDGDEIRSILESRLAEMARVRGIKIKKLNYRVETMDVPDEYYGCVLAAIVYLNY